MTESSTIAALATAPQPAGIAVIRVSGPRTRTALRAIFKSKQDPIEHPRQLIFGDLLDFRTNQIIDQALAVFMPEPHSYTGEDVVEFQFHGSPVLVEKILQSLFAYGVSPAEAGEFTKRAFLNGKVDLVQAEAICDLINATSEQALKLASENMAGRFSKTVIDLGEPLRNVLAEMEAGIDFPDEPIEPAKLSEIASTISSARSNIAALLETYSYGKVIKDGFRVLLCGRPNVGKSSLLNQFLGTQRAIVTDVSGTTRDLIEEAALIGGYRFVFCDSAGITETNEPVEKIGIELAKNQIGWADVVLFVVDATDTTNEWQKVLGLLRGKAKRLWMVTNKIDLNPNAIGAFFCDSQTCQQNFYISVKRGDGLDALTQALIDEVKSNSANCADASQIITNERHRNCLERADRALLKTLEVIDSKQPPEIASAELRYALLALEEIVGKTYTEDILGRIFSRFCIGK